MLGFMMNKWIWAIGLSLSSICTIAGCAESQEGDAVLRQSSGRRLVPRYFVGEDGSKQVRAWRDTKLDMNCYFRRESMLEEDGKMDFRCVPEAFYPDEDSYFTDQDCTEPVTVVHVYDCESLTKVEYVRNRAKSCGESPEYRKVTTVERVGSDDKLWRKYRSSSASAQERCEEVRSNAKEQILRVELGDSIDYESFVRASEERAQ